MLFLVSLTRKQTYDNNIINYTEVLHPSDQLSHIYNLKESPTTWVLPSLYLICIQNQKACITSLCVFIHQVESSNNYISYLHMHKMAEEPTRGGCGLGWVNFSFRSNPNGWGLSQTWRFDIHLKKLPIKICQNI